jgi:NAD(P)-dependent dehydrogenase (short-subunit alcohol dehydrogenase family)
MKGIPMSLKLFDLTGKVAIVTGSGRGLGKVFAKGLAACGARIVTCSRTLSQAETTAEEIRENDGEALALSVDTTVRSQCRKLVETAVKHFGGLHVLVCNAGVAFFTPAEEISDDEWNRTIATNLSGYFYCAQEVARQMIQQGDGGSIVMISSNASLVGFPGLTAYCASKGGVDQLVRSMAVEWGSRGIRVNAVNPGYTDNLMSGLESDISGAEEEAIGRMTPLQRRGRSEEMLGPVIFLASDASSFVTGTTLLVDGGWCAQ